MFRSTYKNTIKNMLRSPTFWLMFAFTLGLCVYNMLSHTYGMYLIETNESITYHDPRWYYAYNTYIQDIRNCIVARICMYALPLFTVSTVAIVLKRDFNDNFYEIEKTSGVRSGCYLSARLAALLTVNFIAALIAVFFSFHLNTARLTMVEGMTLGTYILDSTARLFCFSAVVAFPCVIFYVGLAFGIGNLFRSSLVSAITGVGYVVTYFVVFFFFRLKLMFDYGIDLFAWLPGLPWKISDYFEYYGTDGNEEFDKLLSMSDRSLTDVFLAFGIIFASFAVFYAISYLRQRKRTT